MVCFLSKKEIVSTIFSKMCIYYGLFDLYLVYLVNIDKEFSLQICIHTYRHSEIEIVKITLLDSGDFKSDISSTKLVRVRVLHVRK